MNTNPSTWTVEQWIDHLRPKTNTGARARLEAALLPTTNLSIPEVAVVDLADRLSMANTPERQYLWGRLSVNLQSRITKDMKEFNGDLSDSTAAAFIEELNGIVQGSPLWQQEAFRQTSRRESTRKLCEIGETPKANRALIEDAFPGCIDGADSHMIPRELHQAERDALESQNEVVELKWKVLLLDPEFHKVLEEGNPAVTREYCQGIRGLEPPGDFGIRVWCEMRSRIGGDNPLLKLLSTPKYLWRGRPRIDLAQAQVNAKRQGNPVKGMPGSAVQKEDPLAFLRHFVRRELRQGQIGALFLGYFETLQVSHSALMKEFGFSKRALKAISVIGRLIADDADSLLMDDQQIKLRKGKGPDEDRSANDRAAIYFKHAWENPHINSKQLVEALNRKFDSTNRKSAKAMIDLAKATRKVLHGP